MKTILLSVCLLVLSAKANCQNLNGPQLLEKAINFHDPQGNWNSFNGTLHITMETPNNSNRDTEVLINLPEEYFHAIAKRDSVTTKYVINKGECIISISDSLRIAKAKTKPNRSHCETSNLYKDYYTYLYGLPMKLKDQGTIIHDKVNRQSFKGIGELGIFRPGRQHHAGDVDDAGDPRRPGFGQRRGRHAAAGMADDRDPTGDSALQPIDQLHQVIDLIGEGDGGARDVRQVRRAPRQVDGMRDMARGLQPRCHRVPHPAALPGAVYQNDMHGCSL